MLFPLVLKTVNSQGTSSKLIQMSYAQTRGEEALRGAREAISLFIT